MCVCSVSGITHLQREGERKEEEEGGILGGTAHRIKQSLIQDVPERAQTEARRWEPGRLAAISGKADDDAEDGGDDRAGEEGERGVEG